MPKQDPLFRLHLDIDERVGSIRAGHADWQCAKGCDNCCRQLAGLPHLTGPEWALLRQGLAALPGARLAEIEREVAALAGAPAGPLVCPMLEQASGACPVYLQRPVACRRYGFYVQRDKGLYCGDIEARLAGGGLAEVVWGNHDAIDRRLAAMGEARSLAEWFGEWMGEPGPAR